MTPNPREDALEKARALLQDIVDMKPPADHTGVWSRAVEALAALSASPSQSEDFLTGYGHQVSQWTEAAVAEQATRSTAAFASPTPYVRPAAEIRAEIERMQKESDGKALYRDHSKTIAALTWTLTPPTQEPNKETPDAN